MSRSHSDTKMATRTLLLLIHREEDVKIAIDVLKGKTVFPEENVVIQLLVAL